MGLRPVPCAGHLFSVAHCRHILAVRKDDQGPSSRTVEPIEACRVATRVTISAHPWAADAHLASVLHPFRVWMHLRGSGLGFAGSRHPIRSGVDTNASTVAAFVPCGQSSDSISRLWISPGPRHRSKCRDDLTSVECPVGRSCGSVSQLRPLGPATGGGVFCEHATVAFAACGFPLAASV